MNASESQQARYGALKAIEDMFVNTPLQTFCLHPPSCFPDLISGAEN